MSLSHRHSSRRASSEFIPPSESWVVAQTAALVLFSSWAFGGVMDWTQNWILGLSLAGLPLIYLRYREFREFALRPFVPAVLWIIFVGIAAANPSHVPGPNGGWTLRAAWLAWLPTSADPGRTLADARIWLAALLQAAVLKSLLREPRAARILWGTIALNGFALAAVGASFHFDGAERLLGVQEAPEKTYFFATFFYKNHWAAFGALSAVCALTLSLQACIALLAGDPAARGRMLLFAGAGLLTAVTLPLPRSRSGALLAAVIVLGYFGAVTLAVWQARATRRRARLWGLALVAIAGGGILTFGATAYAPRAAVDFERTRQQLTRTLDGESLDVRMPVSRDTWRMARQRPWFGWGPGTYEIVFPIFQGAYLRGADGRRIARFEFAHNDWLQMVAEVGFVGAALFLIPVALCGATGWRRAGLAGRYALAGCAVLAAYAWIDFPFHNPAVVMLWVTLLATAHRLGGPDRASSASRRRAPVTP